MSSEPMSNQFFAAYTEQQLIVQERQSELRAAVRAHEDYHPAIVAAADRLVAAKHQLEDFRVALRGELKPQAQHQSSASDFNQASV